MMPELPEVEEVRRSLEPHVVGVKIVGVRVLRGDFITGDGIEGFVGKTVTRTYRHGKKLFLITGREGLTLMVHLGMSGYVDCVKTGTAVEKHTHVIFSLAGGKEMRMVDPRRFGGVWVFDCLAAALEQETKGLGKDALEIQASDLAMWKGAKGRLKQRLLSQKDVAGLGNIYVDEAAWMCRLHPLQRVSRITDEKVKELVEAIHLVLRRSLELGGTTIRSYRNSEKRVGEFVKKLQVYGRGGKECLRCGTKLKVATVATRTTVFCPVCQSQR